MITPVVAFIVAIEVLLLTHTPPPIIVSVFVVAMLLSIQIGPAPSRSTSYLGLMVPVSESELQPVAVLRNTNLTVPAEIPETKPALFTVATAGFELIHVPPVVGDNWLVNPAQIVDGPVKDAVAGIFTVTGNDWSEIQPVASVKVNLALPGPTAVTTPVTASTIATEGLTAAQVPEPAGDIASAVVAPIHI